ncbi:MAG: thiol-disulfide isomerase [Acidobacteriota bacterium]
MLVAFVSFVLTAVVGLAGEEPVTYSEHVRPILEQHCASCHREGEVAPMALRTFEQTRPWARAIARETSARRMPPWFADAEAGVFRNDARLADAEVDLLQRWAQQGAAQGPPIDAGAPAAFDGWRLGTPDRIVAMPEPFPIPAQGEIDYVYVLLDTGLDEDRWLRGVEVLAGERSVIHHIDVMLCSLACRQDLPLRVGQPGFLPRSKITEPPIFRRDADLDGDGGDFLFSYLPGGQPVTLPAGSGRLLPRGSMLLLSLHYTATGEAVSDLTRVGLYFDDAPPQKRVLSMIFDNQTIWIPAGEDDYVAASEATFGVDVELLALTPHMHFRGRASEILATFPDGRRMSLLSVPRYDFNWQITYVFAEPVRLPAGTRVTVNSTFDNSASNPFNPDPTVPVAWGRQSWDEMSSAFLEIAVPLDTDLERLIAPSEAVP